MEATRALVEMLVYNWSSGVTYSPEQWSKTFPLELDASGHVLSQRPPAGGSAFQDCLSRAQGQPVKDEVRSCTMCRPSLPV